MERAQMARALRPLLPELTRFSRWLVGSGPEAEELVHEVVLRALEHSRQLEDPLRLRPWLFRAARNARVDLLRAGASRARLLVLEGGLEDLEGLSFPSEPLPRELDRLALERALTKMPELSRAVVLLADLWELSYEEIGEVLELPTGTVGSRLARGRAWLAREILAGHTDRSREDSA
jgi:RNA polymerase sigma-70 factor (ECF subfamily)